MFMKFAGLPLLLLIALGGVLFSSSAFSKDSIVTRVSVTDYLGREVTLAAPAQRIIALAPHIVENLYSAGAGPHIVGAVDYCDYPEAANAIPRVGAVSTYSLETIIAMKPDLVVVWMSTRGGEILHQLSALGINTYASDPHRLEDIAKSIRDYGVLNGTAAHAEKNAVQFERDLAQLKAQYLNRTPVKIFYQVWFDPLQTLNANHIISDVMAMCGGDNIFGSEALLAPKVSMEALLDRNPQVIVGSGAAADFQTWANRWARWPNIDAVKKGHLYNIPGDLIERHTLRILEGAKLMCSHLDRART